ncbi:MAG: NADH-quinone oxidoreductase subunit M [bacterium]|nr:NADH-quinone oxidoreductase subunit M [bacterium]
MEHIISIPFLIFIPMLVAFLLMSPFFTNNEIVIRRFVKTFCAFHFIYAILMLAFFDSANPYLTTIHFWGLDWIQSMGVKFSFKIDSVGIILTTLTSFIFMIAAISSKLNIRKNHKFYYSMLLILMSAILGIFTSNDMFLFFMFWELELIPAYFLIGGKWNTSDNEDAKKSAVKFVIFTFTGSIFMLVGILLLHYYNYISTGVLSGDFADVLTTSIPTAIQYLIAICFLIAFGVKLPIIPLHTWLPDAHTNAPTPISIVLAGILLKTGAYGIYRFNYQMMNETFVNIAPILAILALINIIYTAFVAYSQTDIKRIVAYSSISNMGLILLGLCAYNAIGLGASVFHMVAHALVTAGLFMICGIVYLRCKTRDINELSGISSNMPRLFGFATLIVLASIGVPAFAPFIGEITTIMASFFSEMNDVLKFVAVFALPLLIVSSCYMLKFLHKGFFGEIKESFVKVNDISMHEFVVLSAITIGLILFGIFPNVILNLMELG